MSVRTFTTLNGPKKRLLWKTWAYYPRIYASRSNDFPVAVKFDGQYPTLVCRLIFNNRIYIGIVKDSRCYFVANNKIRIENPLEYLYVQ